jgi:hypothetical protein
MERRAFLAATGAVLLAAPLAAEAQQTRKVPRIGVSGGQSPEALAKKAGVSRAYLSRLEMGTAQSAPQPSAETGRGARSQGSRAREVKAPPAARERDRGLAHFLSTDQGGVKWPRPA